MTPQSNLPRSNEAVEQWRAVGCWSPGMLERGRWWPDRARAEIEREAMNGGVPALYESWLERRWITEPERVDA